MKVLVDTSVWIDFFRAKQTVEVAKLEALIGERQDVCYCGFVLAEILQAMYDDDQYKQVKGHFEGRVAWYQIPMTLRTFPK